MTDSGAAFHSPDVTAATRERVPEIAVSPTAEAGVRLSFASVYEAHFDFVWRNVRRLGVAEINLDDAVQEVFVVVHRKLPEFEGRSSVQTWLFGILRRVARDHRRVEKRRGLLDELPPELADTAPRPDDEAGKQEAVRLLDRLLQHLDEDKRAVFVLAELEQMTAPEIALALDVKLNTVYSRLRAARREFEEVLARHSDDPEEIGR